MEKFIGNYENFISSYGECNIEVAGDRICIKLQNVELGNAEAEIAMQEYCDQNPQGGKFGNNAVQKSEEFDGEFVSEIY